MVLVMKKLSLIGIMFKLILISLLNYYFKGNAFWQQFDHLETAHGCDRHDRCHSNQAIHRGELFQSESLNDISGIYPVKLPWLSSKRHVGLVHECEHSSPFCLGREPRHGSREFHQLHQGSRYLQSIAIH